MGNKLDNEVTLDGTTLSPGVATGYTEWRNAAGFQQGAFFAGFGPPTGFAPDLGGPLTGNVALYLQMNFVIVPGPPPLLSPLWITSDAGTTWHQMLAS
jgi:hypothetical protein